jgi:photosystem II stability/assembly factor-like uncharacterized protein
MTRRMWLCCWVLAVGVARAPSAAAVEMSPAPELLPAPDGLAWTRTDGPYGGWVETFAVAPSDGRTVYALVMGRLYATDDAGEHWRLTTGGGRGVAVDPQKPRTVYTTGNGIQRSDDGGETWQQHGPKLDSDTEEAIVAHPTQPGVVYCLRSGGTLVRWDLETVTELADFGEPLFYAQLFIDPRNTDLLAVSQFHKPWRVSTDGGTTWHTLPEPHDNESVAFVAGSATDPALILALTFEGNAYFTLDHGQRWELYADPSNPGLWTDEIRQTVREAFPLPPSSRRGEMLHVPFWRVASVVANPQDRDRVYVPVVEEGLYRSDNRGKIWKPANRGLGVLPLDDLVALPDTPGALAAASVKSLITTTRDGGKTWASVRLGEDRVTLAAHPQVPGLLFAADGQVGIYRSTDFGASWRAVLEEIGGLGTGPGLAFYFDPDEHDHILLFGEGGVLESADGGANWKVAATFKPPYATGIDYALIVGNGAAITIGSRGERPILQTRDRGATWHALRGPSGGQGPVAMIGRPGQPGALCVLGSRDPDTGSAALWLTDDLGETWQARPLPVCKGSPNALARNPAAPEMLAVGFEDGAVWLSPDEGKTWRDLGVASENGVVEILAFSPADRRLYASMRSEGVFWIELPAGE